MKKRVLQFIGSFNQGGSERQAVALCRLLKNEGSFDVYAATLNNEGILRPKIDAIGLPEIPEFPLTSFYNANFVKQVRACAKYLKENEIDLIHTHDFYTNVFGMAAASLAGVKARIASKRETGGMRSGSQDMVEKLAFSRANAIVVNSHSVQKYLELRGIADTKIKVIYNGLDIERFNVTSKGRPVFSQKYSLPDDEGIRLITLVANLRHDVKNIPMLLRAAKSVVHSKPNAHFVIAGEGGLKDGLQAMAVELGITKNVHFIGRCTDVPELLANSYACVLTSTAEGFSNSILEYMAAGKPVVATNVGGASEAIVHDKCGFLIDSDDDSSLVAHLLELLDDSSLATRFGAEGKRIVASKFSEAAQSRQTIELYDSLLR
ncbi:MAG: glycosyltransferase [Pyrinomonadaceae bacterium]